MEGAHQHMRLNEWHRMFETIYYRTQNVERDQFRIFTHLVEVSGGFLKKVSRGNYDDAERWVAKIFAWYFAFLKAVGIREIEQVVWDKYPRLCPYCAQDQCECGPIHLSLNPDFVRTMGSQRQTRIPGPLDSWQEMFDSIYRQSSAPNGESSIEWLQHSCSRLVEELGEAAEALRLQPFNPQNLRNELADVFARMCGLINALPPADETSEPPRISEILWRYYPNRCGTCGQEVCICRPVPVREFISQSGVFEGPETDPLTSAYNHHRLQFEYVKLRERFPRGGLGVLMIDCDNFKWFNDKTPGRHAQGDKVLASVASAASSEIGDSGALYRRGGDEFVALLPGISATEAEAIACRLLRAVKALRIPDVTNPAAEPYSVSVSIGVIHHSSKRSFVEAERDLADEAMYDAKGAGKGRVSRPGGELVDCG